MTPGTAGSARTGLAGPEFGEDDTSFHGQRQVETVGTTTV
jgi:hypothetical protein